MSDTPTNYDPKDYTVDEVVQYAKDHPAEAEQLLAAERAGRDRSTLTAALEAQIAEAANDGGSGDGNDGQTPPAPGATGPDGQPLASADGSANGGTPVVTDPNRTDPDNPPEGYVEGRAATAQPTGDPAHDAPPYSDNATPPETRADYASVETSSSQETTIEGGDPNASDS